MPSKYSEKDWVREKRRVGIFGVPIASAVAKIGKAAEGLETAALSYEGHSVGAVVAGWRPKTDKDRQAEQARKDAEKKAQDERRKRDAQYAAQRKAEQDARDAQQAKALVDQLRKAGYVIVKGKG